MCVPQRLNIEFVCRCKSKREMWSVIRVLLSFPQTVNYFISPAWHLELQGSLSRRHMGRHDTAEFNLIYCTSVLCITALAPAACVSSNTIWKRCPHQVNTACSNSGKKHFYPDTQGCFFNLSCCKSLCIWEKYLPSLKQTQTSGHFACDPQKSRFSLCIAEMESCVYTVIGACKLTKIA